MTLRLVYHNPSKSLLIATKDTDRITQHIPKSRVVNVKGRELVQVRLGLDEAKVLRNLGVESPSPIRYDYDFPTHYPAPMSHQVTTSEFLTLYMRAMCLNEPGTGKTLSVLWALDYLMSQGKINKAIVCCPKSILSVWEDECNEHLLFRRKCVVVRGDPKRRQQLLDMEADIYVINHDGLKSTYKALAARKDINAWVIDEASEGFRNAKTERYEALEELLSKIPSYHLWLLTGTPVSSSPVDAWAYGRLLGNPKTPRYWSAFRDATMIQITPYKWVPKSDAYERAYEVMQPGIRFRKEDCTDLPPVTYRMHLCELSTQQDKEFKKMSAKLVMEATGGTVITAANAAVKLTKLLQICAGAVYDNDSNPHLLDSKVRQETCYELIAQTERKVIVFVPFTACLHNLAAFLRTKKITVEVVNGATTATERSRIFEAFQKADHPKVLVCHPKTVAHGLTLTRADTTIWYAPTHSAEHYDQGNNRMNRPGQKFSMSVHMLFSHPLEYAVYKALQTKKRMQDCVLDLYKQYICND